MKFRTTLWTILSTCNKTFEGQHNAVAFRLQRIIAKTLNTRMKSCATVLRD